MKNKSLGYNLFIDRDTNDALLILLNTFRIAGEKGILKDLPEGITTVRKIMTLAESINKHTHSLGWCNDPDCEKNQPNAN